MTTNERLLEALHIAEQMEIAGKDFYLKMAEASVNRRGKELYRALASEEDVHREDFRSIYEAIQNHRPLPATATTCSDVTRIRRLFSQAAPDLEPDIAATAEELEAIDTAVEMEENSINHYKRLLDREPDPATRTFYEAVIRQEINHRAALLDYRSYLLDPDGWLISKTKPSAGICYTPRAIGHASEIEW